MSEAWTQAATVANFLAVRGGIPFAQEQLDILIAVVRKANRPIERVLDLGCGTGVVGQAVMGAFPGAVCDFVDFSEAMLAQCRKNLHGHAQCRVFMANLETEPLGTFLGSRRYDAVVSGFALHHLTEMRKPQIFGEIFDVLEPGGVFVNMEHVESQSRRGAEMWETAIVDGLYAYQAAQGGTKTRLQVADDYHARADKDVNILEPASSQCYALFEVGFEDADLYFKYLEMAVYGGFKPGGPGGADAGGGDL